MSADEGVASAISEQNEAVAQPRASIPPLCGAHPFPNHQSPIKEPVRRRQGVNPNARGVAKGKSNRNFNHIGVRTFFLYGVPLIMGF
jgi:hypothetical protein